MDELLDNDTKLFVIGILATFPLGYVMSFVPFGTLKHIYASCMGLFLLLITMRYQ